MIEYMPFGKYSGRHLSDIPRSYLEWLLEQDWLKKEDLIEAIENELAIWDRSYVDF